MKNIFIQLINMCKKIFSKRNNVIVEINRTIKSKLIITQKLEVRLSIGKFDIEKKDLYLLQLNPILEYLKEYPIEHTLRGKFNKNNSITLSYRVGKKESNYLKCDQNGKIVYKPKFKNPNESKVNNDEECKLSD
jgi:hypothetical protein